MQPLSELSVDSHCCFLQTKTPAAGKKSSVFHDKII